MFVKLKKETDMFSIWRLSVMSHPAAAADEKEKKQEKMSTQFIRNNPRKAHVCNKWVMSRIWSPHEFSA